MSRQRAGAILLGLLLGAACARTESSISLEFPNEQARLATARLEVFAFDPEAVGFGGTAGCGAFLGTLGRGEQIQGEPIQEAIEAPFEGKQIAGFPAGHQIVFVVGSAVDGEVQTPIVEGCNEDFGDDAGSDDVSIPLRVIVPEGDLALALRKVSGDRQAGGPGETLMVPVAVELTGVFPGTRGRQHPLPGLAIVMRPSAGLDLGAGAGVPVRLDTDPDGRAALSVTLPDALGEHSIEASAEPLDVAALDFGVSVVAGLDPASLRVDVISPPLSIPNPIEIRAGDVSGSAARDLVVLGCRGDAAACVPGRDAIDPAGETVVVVLRDVVEGGAAQVLERQGRLPSGLVVADLVPDPADRADIAFLNGRREVGGVVRSGSEIVWLQGGAGDVSAYGRFALTASNAVGLAPYAATPSARRPSLVTVSQGRRVYDRPCTIQGACLPPDSADRDCVANPEMCGCPPGDKCLCPSGMNCLFGDPGVCTGDDWFIDKLVNRLDGRAGDVINLDGCHQPVLSCSKTGGAPSDTRCACTDAFRRNSCTSRDGCQCFAPNKSLLGTAGNPRPARNLAIGPLRGAGSADVVVASVGGIDFLEYDGLSAWSWRTSPVAVPSTHGVLIERIDRDPVPDVAFWVRGPCERVPSCPRQPTGVVETEARGCVGVVLRDSLTALDAVTDDGCRQFPLAHRPDSVCQGDFDGDLALDLAVSSAEADHVLVFSGDGHGGFRSPPARVMLPGGRTGGPMTCARLDGDQREDMAVVSVASGDVVVLRTER
jgi:hypothetical protein